MEIIKEKNKITILSADSFDVRDIFNCGQIFRYNIFDTYSRVLSSNHCADIIEENGKNIIICDDSDYFYNFFDLDTDYSKIKKVININPLMDSAINHGQGIRILNNDLYEIIISFIISSNNNIGRIKKSVEFISRNLGVKMGAYYSFPTQKILADADEAFFKAAGCGYRSRFLVYTARQIFCNDICNQLKSLDTPSATKQLLKLMGVGAKVADCILLFGLHKTDVFPVDVWIKRVYSQNFGGKLKEAKAIREFFINLFGQYSGYAQQYLFYYKRDIKDI